MQPTFVPVQLPEDSEAIINLLTSNEWPFHGSPQPDRAEAASIQVAGSDTKSFWIELSGERIGLVRAFDLDDVIDGSPLIDIRITSPFRNRGFGRFAVDELTKHLFESHPALHRIEATTRNDNEPMKSVLSRCGYRQEGRLIEAWRSRNGERFDTLIYAILRSEWTQIRGNR